MPLDDISRTALDRLIRQYGLVPIVARLIKIPRQQGDLDMAETLEKAIGSVDCRVATPAIAQRIHRGKDAIANRLSPRT